MINNRQGGRRRGRGGQPQRSGQPGLADRGNRIDNRARGNANQLHEKYKTLARDSQMQGDRVTTEYYLQFADHYFRVMMESRARFEEQRRPRDDYGDERGPYAGDDQRGDDQGADGGDDDPYGYDGEAIEAERAPPRDDRRREYRNGQANGHGGQPPRTEEVGGDDRGNRRPRRANRDLEPVQREEAVSERIEFDRLPPAFAASSEGQPDDDSARGEEGEAKPRRRGRPRRNPDAAEAEA